MSSSLSPSLLSTAPSTTTTTAAAVTEAAAFAVSSSAAAVTFFFLFFFYFVFHDFFLAASGFAPTPPPVSVVAFPFPITTKRFHVCLHDTHTLTYKYILFFLSNIYRFLCLAPLTAPWLPLPPNSCLIVIIACE